MSAGELVTSALAIFGVVVMTIAVLGIVRMPDAFARIHAANKALVLGVVAVLAASIGTGDLSLFSRAALVGLFVLVTSPLGSHALARLEHRRRCEEGDQPSPSRSSMR